MKLFYIEDKYILIYRVVIVIVLSLTLLMSIIGGLYGTAKWSGLLSNVNKVEKQDNEFQNPDTNNFIEKYKEKKEEPKVEKEVEVEPEKEEEKVNKDQLFKQQAERLASLQKAFMNEQNSNY